MIYTTENNWYGWKYDEDIFGRQLNSKCYSTFFKPDRKTFLSFKEELLLAASTTLDSHPGLTPCIFFSGGVDSEVLLRAFADIGSSPNVYIVRYENDINIYDVSYAVVACNQLGVKYKIIDFNLKRFYENDAESISEKAQIDRPRALPQLKFMDYVDGLPLYGSADLTLMRSNDDYSTKSGWFLRCWEHDTSWSKYARTINRPAVLEWFKWSPGIVYSYFNTIWCQHLINDDYYGKLGTNSTKIIGYREAYPDLVSRTKKTGFEEFDLQYINEFEQFLSKKYNGLNYRNGFDRSVEELANIFTGS